MVVALVGCLVGFVLLPPLLEGWRGFALNLATEIVGILLTVFLIDAVLRRREDREQARYRSLALRQLWRPLNRQADLFSNIYKASAERRPKREISSVSELFDEDYFNAIERLDATAASGTVRGVMDQEGMPWYECIDQEMSGFKEALGHMIDKYAMYLDPDTIDVVERLIDSNFINVGRLGRIVVENARQMGLQGPVPMAFMALGNDADSPIRKYTDDLVELVKIYDETAAGDKKVRIPDPAWRDDISPQVGSARIPDELIRDERNGPQARKEDEV